MERVHDEEPVGVVHLAGGEVAGEEDEAVREGEGVWGSVFMPTLIKLITVI